MAGAGPRGGLHLFTGIPLGENPSTGISLAEPLGSIWSRLGVSGFILERFWYHLSPFGSILVHFTWLLLCVKNLSFYCAKAPETPSCYFGCFFASVLFKSFHKKRLVLSPYGYLPGRHINWLTPRRARAGITCDKSIHWQFTGVYLIHCFFTEGHFSARLGSLWSAWHGFLRFQGHHLGWASSFFAHF